MCEKIIAIVLKLNNNYAVKTISSWSVYYFALLLEIDWLPMSLVDGWPDIGERLDQM